MTILVGCRAPYDPAYQECACALPTESVFIPPINNQCVPPGDPCVPYSGYQLAAPAWSAQPRLERFAQSRGKTQRPITVEEAREIALANNKRIAVLGYIPDETETLVSETLGFFDPVFEFGARGGKTDRQVRDLLATLGAPSTTQDEEFFLPYERNQFEIQQQLQTGGFYEIGLSTAYSHLDPAGVFTLKNPAWFSSLNFAIEQPLGRGRGPDYALAPIAIARANQHESVQEFEAAVQEVVLAVEVAYWNLYLAYEAVETSNESLIRSADTLQRQKDLLEIGGDVGNEVRPADVDQALEQYEEFRIDYIDAQQILSTAELALRQVLGIAAADDWNLVPNSPVNTEELEVNWEAAVTTAQLRPELLAQQAAIRAADIALRRQQNGLRPDVAFRFDYAVTGLEERFDDSMATIDDNRFNDWTVGLIYRHPLGKRAEWALVQRANLALRREMATYDELELQIISELNEAYQNLAIHQSLIAIHQRRLEAARKELEARQGLFAEGDERTTLTQVLDAEERYRIDKLGLSSAVSAYQASLARWRFASGTLLRDNVVIAGNYRVPRAEEVPLFDPPANQHAPDAPQVPRPPQDSTVLLHPAVESKSTVVLRKLPAVADVPEPAQRGDENADYATPPLPSSSFPLFSSTQKAPQTVEAGVSEGRRARVESMAEVRRVPAEPPVPTSLISLPPSQPVVVQPSDGPLPTETAATLPLASPSPEKLVSSRRVPGISQSRPAQVTMPRPAPPAAMQDDPPLPPVSRSMAGLTSSRRTVTR